MNGVSSMLSTHSHHDVPGPVEINVFFERTADKEVLLERIQVPKETSQEQICDRILYAWGKAPKIDEINFMMAQGAEGAVVVTKPDLLTFVASNPNLYA